MKKEVSKWEERLSQLQQKASQEMARANALETERRALALAAADGDEKSEKAMNRKAAEAEEARRQSDNFALMAREAERNLESLRDELAEAESQAALDVLREASGQHNPARIERVVAELVEALRTAKSFSAQIALLAERVGVNFDARSNLFKPAVAYVLWSLKRELSESDLLEWSFAPRDPKAEPQGALVQHERWYVEGLVAAAERSIQGAKLARERARGLIRVEEGEQLYRALHRLIGVRGLNLQPGELIALRPDEAEDLAEAVELTEGAPDQAQVA
ncbi:MAG: hypothetical protein K6U09_10020 [Acidobacteriia bacterium]|nr:hypothetical protein [Terriglobia bacterium]